MPEKVDQCVKSVMRDNPDMDESQAFTICEAADNEGRLAEANLQDTTTVFEDVDSCEVAMDDAGLDNPREVCEQLFAEPTLSEPLFVRLADVRQPGPIERVEEDGGAVRYKNLKLLGTGVWGDSGTQSHFLYSDRTIEALADSVVDTTANLFHEQENEVAEVGDLDPESVYIGEADDGLYGDLVLDRENAASEFADEALRNALETDGRQGLKGPSLEIKNPDYEFDMDSGVMEVVDGEIHGIALVGLGVSAGPGSKDVAFDRQTAERAVALADADQPTIITLQDHAITMDEDTIREQLSEYDIQLGDDADAETLQTLADALDLQEDEEDDEEMPDDDMDGEDGSDDGEDGDDESDDDEQDVDVNLEAVVDRVDQIGEQVQANSQRLEEMAETVNQLSDQTVDIRESEVSLSDLREQVEEVDLSDTVSDIDDRLTALEDSLEEPQSLADIGDTDANTDDEGDIVLREWSGPHRTSHDSFAVRRKH